MYARIVQFTGATDVDGGVEFVRNTVAPLIRQQHGYLGMVASADRDARVFGVMSNWESAADLDASDSALRKVREDATKIIGGQMSVEFFEQAAFVAKQPPTVGAALLVRRVSMDPARVEENLEFFRTTVLPELEAAPGIVGVRQLINRETGHGLVGTVWDSVDALEAAAAAAEERRSRAAGQGVTFGDQTKREILLVDMP